MRAKLFTANSIPLLITLAIGLFVAISALSMPFTSALFPGVFGAAIALLSLIAYLREVRRPPGQKAAVMENEIKESKEARAHLRAYLDFGGWTLGFIVAIYFLGLLFSCPLLVAGYMKAHGSKWIYAISSAIACAGFMYFGFEIGLQVPLYKGIFGF